MVDPEVTPLTDDDVLLFGKYKGLKLKDVPAGWLLWALEEITPDSPYKERLLAYVIENQDLLIDERQAERE